MLLVSPAAALFNRPAASNRIRAELKTLPLNFLAASLDLQLSQSKTPIQLIRKPIVTTNYEYRKRCRGLTIQHQQRATLNRHAKVCFNKTFEEPGF